MKRALIFLALLLCLVSCVIAASGMQGKSTAILFVGHGEPARFQDGEEVVQFPDGSFLGPCGGMLGVPPEEQNTIWAACYEEVACAMTYEMGDLNQNGIKHELGLFPFGDVPPYFTWQAFKGLCSSEYAVLGESPHNRLVAELVADVRLNPGNKNLPMHLAFIDAHPFIEEKVFALTRDHRIGAIVVVPLFLSHSTHTQEIEEIVTEWVEKSGREIELIFAQPFFELPYVQSLHASSVAAMVQTIRGNLPAGVADSEIGVVLATHGDPFKPPYPEFGYEPGDIYSYLYLTEKDFAEAIKAHLPYETLEAANEFRPPTVESCIDELAARGKTHIIVVPAVFPTACIHTMWDLAQKAVQRPVAAQEGIVSMPTSTGATVWFCPLGYGDMEPGRSNIVKGLRFATEVALLELAERTANTHGCGHK